MSLKEPARSLSVVVVDDNHDATDTLVLLLKVIGHDARGTYDARSGMRLITDIHPDLAIFDMDMPKLDGCAALEELRRTAPHLNTFFVCLTGQSTREAKQRCMAAGFHRFITKPIVDVELEAVLDLVSKRAKGTS
ncbi:MAG: response regulator [Povalibacter sp.]|jgi:CheY-like chemotaxis protein